LISDIYFSWLFSLPWPNAKLSGWRAGFLPDGSAMSSYRLVSGFRRAGGMARLAGLQVPLPIWTTHNSNLVHVLPAYVAGSGKYEYWYVGKQTKVALLTLHLNAQQYKVLLMCAGQATDAAAGCLPHADSSGGATAHVQPDLAAGRAAGCARQRQHTASSRASLDAELKGHKVTCLHTSPKQRIVIALEMARHSHQVELLQWLPDRRQSW
jgi:hypothetical protein